MTPTRVDLIRDYWLDELGHYAIAKKHRMGRVKLGELFKEYGILSRVVGGKRNNEDVNQTRLKLMLLPSVEEYYQMRGEKWTPFSK